MKKLKKQLALTLSALILVIAITPIVATATDKYSYALVIPRVQQLTHTPYTLYRNTNQTSNKWGVKLTHSNEHTAGHPDGSAKTGTTFWLGVDNPNGINPVGSKKVVATEGSLFYTKTEAFSNASLENVYLYASDNAATNASYDVEGYWYAFTS